MSGGTSGAVYRQNGPAEVTNAGGLSLYGTMAQGGNVLEWNENAYDLSNDSPTENRELSGGYWKNDGYGSNLDASSRHPGVSPNYEYEWMGFRVASVPEPSSLSLLLAGGAVLMAGRRRNRD